ncbi:MAG: RNA methyltransferase [Chloroflexi bacterium]|nr:RNA methyltransferase [Chloroflexota bacterium]
MTAPGTPGGAITSAANPRVRGALDLRDRRGRERTGRLLVDGVREVSRALEAGAVLVEAFVGAEPRGAEAVALVSRLVAAGVPLVAVAGAAEARLAYGDRRSEVVAVVAAPPLDLAHLEQAIARTADPLLVVVEDAEKPGNLGAIIRSADGAGAAGLLAATGRGPAADPWNPNAVRASVGGVLGTPLAVAPTDEVLAWLRRLRFRIVAARVEAATDYRRADLRGRVAIVVGSEARGLGPAWAAGDVVAVRLPMRGRADSLNVSAAAAVLLYEALRQREADPGAPAP